MSKTILISNFMSLKCCVRSFCCPLISLWLTQYKIKRINEIIFVRNLEIRRFLKYYLVNRTKQRLQNWEHLFVVVP